MRPDLPIQDAAGKSDVVQVELVVVPGCPHEQAAAALLRRALDDIGLGSQPFEVVVVDSQSVADAMHFLGSPTFMVDGCDVIDEPARPAALACRIYREGHPLPAPGELRRALEVAATDTAFGARRDSR